MMMKHITAITTITVHLSYTEYVIRYVIISVLAYLYTIHLLLLGTYLDVVDELCRITP